MTNRLRLGLLLAALPAAAAPVTLVNHGPFPVHAAAVPVAADTSRWAFVSLPPTSRVEVAAEAGGPVGEKFRAVWDPARTNGELRNGVVAFTLGSKGWTLGFDGPGTNRPGLIRDGQLDFWIDAQSRGRIANGDPRAMGLLRFETDARTESCTATLSNGRPALVRTSRFGGFAPGFTVTETFELVPAQPLLLCRVAWRNDGDTPLWIAYVGSGDGIRGKWDKTLMPVPLIERKKSPVLGDLNGSETRCAWVGGLCRISMESPATGCGVGLSTLLPTPGRVGQGSMIWGCGAYGFQCNFIDPELGQFPFPVQPHTTRTNGFAFLAAQAGVSVHRQTVALWNALQKETLPDLAPPCAVYVDGKAVQPQTVAGLPDRPDLWVEKAGARTAALRMDLNRSFTVRVNPGADFGGLTATRLASSKPPVTLLAAGATGPQEIDLNAALGVTDEVAFVLSAKGAASVAIDETLPGAPEMLSPVADASMTDLAAMFRWTALPTVVDYELQYARAADFASAVVVRVTSSEPYPWHLVPDDQLPAPGRWQWRIRGLKQGVTGAWSAVRAFTVNDDHTTRPLRRPLTAERPLFTLEATRVLDFTNFRPDLPPDLAPFFGIVVEGMEGRGIPVTDFARGMEQLPHPLLLRSHWVGLADIEWLFQHVTNFAGIQGGEHLTDLYRDSPRGEMRYAHRLLRLCAKYGMVFQEADGTYKDDKWQDLMDREGPFIRRYGPWLVLSQKNNIIRRQFYSQSAAMGLWLGGITCGHGAWEDGGFYWQNAGFKETGVCVGERSGELRTMPPNFWSLVSVMGIARGCTLHSFDGQTVMDSAKLNARDPKEAWASALWDDTGRTTPAFQRHVVPLVRAAVQRGLVPDRDTVRRNVRLAVFNDMKGKGDVQTWTHYAEYGPLFAGTYGFRKMGRIDGQLWEFFPNTGRYYFIPALPQGDEPLGPGVRNVPLSALQDTTKVRALFDAAYPAIATNEAFACAIGRTICVFNTHENEDVTESFALPVEAGPVRRISGRVAPNAYLLGQTGTSLWLQAGVRHSDRPVELRLGCTRKPVWRVEPADAIRRADWNVGAGTLELDLLATGSTVEVVVE